MEFSRVPSEFEVNINYQLILVKTFMSFFYTTSVLFRPASGAVSEPRARERVLVREPGFGTRRQCATRAGFMYYPFCCKGLSERSGHREKGRARPASRDYRLRLENPFAEYVRRTVNGNKQEIY